MTKQEIDQLLTRYADGTASESEKEVVERWYAATEYPNNLQVQDYEDAKRAVWRNLNPHHRRRTRFLRYAAMFIALSSISLLYYSVHTHQKTVKLGDVSEIMPGGNYGTLFIGQDDSVNLNLLATGDIIVQHGIKIEKLSEGVLSYNIDSIKNVAVVASKLIVPRGGQYSVVLSDGSKIFLNSESIIEFPSRFIGGERRVKMQGEVYFEVAENKKQPFVVESKGQEVAVLGTKFNIRAYPNDIHTSTTLIEGKVEVSTPKSNVVLLPGDQSIFDGDDIQVVLAKTANEVSWKNELFLFDGETLGSIMQKIARWYNVDFVFEDMGLEEKKFTGSISRHQNIDQVIRLLEMTGKVRFTIRNKTLYVQRNN